MLSKGLPTHNRDEWHMQLISTQNHPVWAVCAQNAATQPEDQTARAADADAQRPMGHLGQKSSTSPKDTADDVPKACDTTNVECG